MNLRLAMTGKSPQIGAEFQALKLSYHDGPDHDPHQPRPPSGHRAPVEFRDAIGRRRARGRQAVLPSRIRPRVPGRRLRANPGADAGGDRLPPRCTAAARAMTSPTAPTPA